MTGGSNDGASVLDKSEADKLNLASLKRTDASIDAILMKVVVSSDPRSQIARGDRSSAFV